MPPRPEDDGLVARGPSRVGSLPRANTNPESTGSRPLSLADSMTRPLSRVVPKLDPAPLTRKTTSEAEKLTNYSVASDKDTQAQEATTNAADTKAEADNSQSPSLADLKNVSHDDVWCVLVLRMLCWLTLHDFHKKDRQMPNSELLGSRLPVFIA